MSYVYYTDQELPAIPLNWSDGTGTVIDFSTGWTFTVKVATKDAPKVIVLTKTTGITGAAAFPNYTIDWSTTDFSGLTGDVDYVIYPYARRTADSKDRVFSPGNLPTFKLRTAAA